MKNHPFSTEQWHLTRENYRRWWSGKLGRPLIHVAVHHNRPCRPEPALRNEAFTAAYGLDTPADQIVDRWDYELARCSYPGDAYPSIWPNFGPGVIAAFMGTDLHYDRTGNTCWFHPKREQELSDLHFSFLEDSPWLRRVRDITKAAEARWQGSVQIGMTDLGGNLDILASFRPSEKLLFDLYDNPNEVKRLTWEAHDAWFRYYEALDKLIRRSNPGYTAWSRLFSPEPYYMLQCDFCYMISPEMFDEFVKPELTAACRKLKNPFYHLDGPGELAHLDSLLSIKELKGIQWIPGAGHPDCEHWPDVYRRIRKAGKLIELHGRLETLDTVVGQLGGDAEGIFFNACIHEDKEPQLNALLKKYGAE